jgi:hypothetical protein
MTWTSIGISIVWLLVVVLAWRFGHRIGRLDERIDTLRKLGSGQDMDDIIDEWVKKDGKSKEEK